MRKWSYVDAVNLAADIKRHDDPKADLDALTNELWAEMQKENEEQ